MHDPRLLSDQLDSLRAQLGTRGNEVPWGTIQSLSESGETLIRQVEDMRHQLKQGSDRIAELKRNKQPADEPMAALRQVREQIQSLELELRTVEEPLREQALSIPNVPHQSVPIGTNEGDNQEIRRWGDLPNIVLHPSLALRPWRTVRHSRFSTRHKNFRSTFFESGSAWAHN